MNVILRRRLLACLAVAVALTLLPGCGGDDDEGSASSTPTTAASSAQTTQAAPSTQPQRESSDRARAEKAKAATLQSGDFPPGWKDDPEAQVDIDRVWQELTRCLGVEQTGPALGIATSPTFRQGLATQARSTVEYMEEPAAKSIAAALAGPKFKECATGVFTDDARRSAPEGGRPGPVAVTPLDFPNLAQTTSASRINVTMLLDELQVPISQDFLVFFDGGTVVRMFFLNPGGPFPPSLERSLVDKVLARI